MKFYDIDALGEHCGTDNKYQITALVAARARWLSEQKTIVDSLPANEKYLSTALFDFESAEGCVTWVEELKKGPETAEESEAARADLA